MAVRALVGRAVLTVVTFIVAKKALGAWPGGGFKKHSGQGLSGGRDKLSSFRGNVRGGTAKKGIFLREPGLGYESFGGGSGSGGDVRCQRGHDGTGHRTGGP